MGVSIQPNLYQQHGGYDAVFRVQALAPAVQGAAEQGDVATMPLVQIGLYGDAHTGRLAAHAGVQVVFELYCREGRWAGAGQQGGHGQLGGMEDGMQKALRWRTEGTLCPPTAPPHPPAGRYASQYLLTPPG